MTATAIAAVLSGAPSTAHALATGADPLAAARAAGPILPGGRPGRARGVGAPGWLVRPGRPVELAGAIGLAMRLDETAYQALAARARQYAQFMFSPESVVSATRAVYTGLLARDR